jgi:hypothetical protein
MSVSKDFWNACCDNSMFDGVATLALGLRPRQGGCKVAGQEGHLGVTSHVPGSAKSVRE